MRKILIWLSALVFGFLTFLTLTVGVTQAVSRPQVKTATVKPTPTLTPTPTPTPVKYSLPYPGILPDNFLYSLKMARDKVLLALTRDPIKRGEMLILFADKRLGAGKALIEGGRTDLGLTTIVKGEKYLEQAAKELKQAGKKGPEAELAQEKLVNSSLKHEEVINQLMAKVNDGAKPTLATAKGYAEQARLTMTGE